MIDTMGEIGRTMDVRYRETAGGGLAATPTGRKARQGAPGTIEGQARMKQSETSGRTRLNQPGTRAALHRTFRTADRIMIQGVHSGPSFGELVAMLLGAIPILGIMAWSAVKILGPIGQALARRIGGGSDRESLGTASLRRWRTRWTTFGPNWPRPTSGWISPNACWHRVASRNSCRGVDPWIRDRRWSRSQA